MSSKKKLHPWLTPFRTSAGRYYNFEGEHTASIISASLQTLLKTLWMRLHNRQTFDMSQWQVPTYQHLAIPDYSVTWLGHATFLIKMGGKTIITDPLFGSPSLLFPRLMPFTLAKKHMGPIDCILISHNHYDHMDIPSIKQIAHETTMIYVPKGDAEFLRSQGIKNVFELTWWKSYEMFTDPFRSIKFTFLPAHHWSGRTPFDRNRSLWGSWMINYGSFNIYFAGDTAYSDHFIRIREKFSHISIALLPISPAEPEKHMRLTHMGPEEAGQAFLDLNAHAMVPMHWGTFLFGSDVPEAPIDRLKIWWKKNQMKMQNKQLAVLKTFEPLTLPHTTGFYLPEYMRIKPL